MSSDKVGNIWDTAEGDAGWLGKVYDPDYGDDAEWITYFVDAYLAMVVGSLAWQVICYNLCTASKQADRN